MSTEKYYNDLYFKSISLEKHFDYIIENNKIVSHWLVADQMVLMQQLGIEQAQAH